MVDIRIPLADRLRGPTARAPSVRAALLAGLIAGTFALAFMQAMATLAYDESAWKLPRMMAAIVRGPAALAPQDDFDASIVVLGLGVHYTLSLLYALALAGLLRELPREVAPLAGLTFGVSLYVANLYAFTSLFPWFAEMRTPDTWVAHVLFGIMAACAYCDFAYARRGEDHPPG